MFHVGHLNLLKRSKEQCDYLIVGVNADELVQQYKNKTPIINQADRAAIVAAIKYVDEVITTYTLDKLEIHEQVHFDKIFIGDDWRGNQRWEQTALDMQAIGAELVWLPYTQGVSSTLIRSTIEGKEVH